MQVKQLNYLESFEKIQKIFLHTATEFNRHVSCGIRYSCSITSIVSVAFGRCPLPCATEKQTKRDVSASKSKSCHSIHSRHKLLSLLSSTIHQTPYSLIMGFLNAFIAFAMITFVASLAPKSVLIVQNKGGGRLLMSFITI